MYLFIYISNLETTHLHHRATSVKSFPASKLHLHFPYSHFVSDWLLFCFWDGWEKSEYTENGQSGRTLINNFSNRSNALGVFQIFLKQPMPFQYSSFIQCWHITLGDLASEISHYSENYTSLWNNRFGMNTEKFEL